MLKRMWKIEYTKVFLFLKKYIKYAYTQMNKCINSSSYFRIFFLILLQIVWFYFCFQKLCAWHTHLYVTGFTIGHGPVSCVPLLHCSKFNQL